MVMHMNRIKDLRLEAEMKQDVLADRIGISRSLISKYERGDIDLSTDSIRRLCEIFGVTSDYLLGFSAVRSFGISEAEWQLVSAYRAADPRARQLVDLALEPYSTKKTAAG